METKFYILIFLLLTIFAFLILPKFKIIKKIKMSSSIFYSIFIIQFICSICGLIYTLISPDSIINDHIFEIFLIPILLIYLFIEIIRKNDTNKKIYDEKQLTNLTQASAITWPVSILTVFFLFAAQKEGMIGGLSFYPIFVFFTLLVYSIFSITYFIKN